MLHMSNNRFPKFTDEECITAYLWGRLEGRLNRKDVYRVIRDYWHDWFPTLHSHQEFCRRLNNLVPAVQALAEVWAGVLCANFEDSAAYIIDSCPIIPAKHVRSSAAKSAPEYCDKSYIASRKAYFYGAKLHAFVVRDPGKLPAAETFMITRASVFDLTAEKEIMLNARLAHSGYLLADKAYCDSAWAEALDLEHHLKVITPRKKAKGDTLRSGDAYSSSVSAMRQPIESFFHWLNAHFHIQDASLVRSAMGLLFHVFSAIAAALFCKLFNS